MPKVKSRASGGHHSVGEGATGCGVLVRNGLAFQEAFVAYGAASCWWVAVLLVVAQCSGSHAAYAPDGSRPVRWYQAESHLLWSGLVRLDTTGPVSPGKPRIRGVGPRTQPLPMVRRIHRTTGWLCWSAFCAAIVIAVDGIRMDWSQKAEFSSPWRSMRANTLRASVQALEIGLGIRA